MVQAQQQQSGRWNHLGLFVAVAAGLLCLVAGTAAQHADCGSSCAFGAEHGGHAGTPWGDLALSGNTVRAIKDDAGAYPPVTPSSRAADRAASPLSVVAFARTDEPREFRALSGVSLFYIAPKHSPPTLSAA